MQSQLVTVVTGGSVVQIYTLTEKMELGKVNEQYFHHPSISKKHYNAFKKGTESKTVTEELGSLSTGQL